jgi:hypothetical protein
MLSLLTQSEHFFAASSARPIKVANVPIADRGHGEKLWDAQYDLPLDQLQVWNSGKKVGAKLALKQKQIWQIRFYLDYDRRLRDRALFDLAIDSKLPGCDLVKIKIGTLVIGQKI